MFYLHPCGRRKKANGEVWGKERYFVLVNYHLNQDKGKRWFWEPLSNYSWKYSGPLYRVMYSSHIFPIHYSLHLNTTSDAQYNLNCCDAVCSVLVTMTKVCWYSVQTILLNVFQSMVEFIGVDVKWQTPVWKNRGTMKKRSVNFKCETCRREYIKKSGCIKLVVTDQSKCTEGKMSL